MSVSPSCGLHALNIPGVLFSIGEVQGQAAGGYRNTQTPLRNSRLMLVATPQEEHKKKQIEDTFVPSYAQHDCSWQAFHFERTMGCHIAASTATNGGFFGEHHPSF